MGTVTKNGFSKEKIRLTKFSIDLNSKDILRVRTAERHRCALNFTEGLR